jgi:hypothetical protein
MDPAVDSHVIRELECQSLVLDVVDHPVDARGRHRGCGVDTVCIGFLCVDVAHRVEDDEKDRDGIDNSHHDQAVADVGGVFLVEHEPRGQHQEKPADIGDHVRGDCQRTALPGDVVGEQAGADRHEEEDQERSHPVLRGGRKVPVVDRDHWPA